MAKETSSATEWRCGLRSRGRSRVPCLVPSISSRAWACSSIPTRTVVMALSSLTSVRCLVRRPLLNRVTMADVRTGDGNTEYDNDHDNKGTEIEGGGCSVCEPQAAGCTPKSNCYRPEGFGTQTSQPKRN